MPHSNKRYSKFIRPIFVFVDVLIIMLVTFAIGDKEFFNVYFLSFICAFWLIIGLSTNFYKVYRFTNFYRVIKLLVIQFGLFVLGYFAYFGIFKEGAVIGNQLLVLNLIIGSIALFKIISYFALKRYRLTGHNYRTAILVGMDEAARKMSELFKNKSDLGYRYLGYFSDKTDKKEDYLGKIDHAFDYIKTQNVDEIYCSIAAVQPHVLKALDQLVREQGKVIKLLPEIDKLYSKNYHSQYYDDLLVLQVEKLPFEYYENHLIKRIFDVGFSVFIIVTVLSWLIPLLYILIKLESRGPLFFKQVREGKAGEHFTCYKFRSMKVNPLSDKVHATKDDSRITRIGAFLRRTSLDELPQFINVLKGEMSVVGPRPHMNKLSLEYQKEIDDYVRRHAVKPGITGLAQISGYRGEVKKRSDIKNRIRLDIFYIENWSFFLDIKIIIKTVLNIFKGEEKAY